MMREKKFRAWNGDRYIELFNLRGGKTIYFSPYDLGVIPPEVRGNVVLEQCSGLKDLNDKEIYEGDIILVANHGRTPYAVIYREGDCSFVCKNENLKDFVHMFKTMPQCYEVIGNIHENPELLEQGNAKD